MNARWGFLVVNMVRGYAACLAIPLGLAPLADFDATNICGESVPGWAGWDPDSRQ